VRIAETVNSRHGPLIAYFLTIAPRVGAKRVGEHEAAAGTPFASMTISHRAQKP
jgi:hypothetical protein